MNDRTVIKAIKQGKIVTTLDASLWETEAGGNEFLIHCYLEDPRRCTEVDFRVQDLLPLAEMIIHANLWRKGGKNAVKLLSIAEKIVEKNGKKIC